MTSRDFCFWLQGVFEMGQPKAFDEVRTELIRKHLALVFKHDIDPSMGTPEHQAELNAIHAPAKPENKVTIEATPHWQRPDHGGLIRC